MKRWTMLLSMPLMLAGVQDVRALSFGSFDPRSMAMGGAGVAAGTSANASFYNPALLAEARSGEDFSLEVPVVGARVADPDQLISSIDDYQNADYPDALSAAINQWNSASTPAELAAAKDSVVASGSDLVNALSGLSNKALQAQLNAGMVVGVPSKRWGMAFYANRRADGGAMLDITQSDLDNIKSVLNTLQNLDLTGLSNSTTNQLPDPTVTMTSAVEARGAVISEVGISLAREFAVAGNSVAFGITPKYMKIATFDYRANVDTADVTLDQGKKSYSDFNVDVGVAHDYGNNWKTGVVVKNLLSKNYTTVLGNIIHIDPQARWGLAYAGSVATVAVDVDLLKNKGTGFDATSQDISLGAEFNVLNFLQLRAGYRYNISDSNTNGAALGVGLSPLGVHMDLAVEGSDREVGAGFQLGFRF
jgi:F plasmid transfer operon, TraF, protein